MTERIRQIFWIVLLVAVLGSIYGNAQTTKIQRPCAGTTVKASVSIQADGDIDLVPCATRSVLVSGLPIGSGGSLRSVDIQSYSSNLGTAITAIGSTPSLLTISGATTCNSAVTVLATTVIEFTNAAKITESGTCTIAFAGVGILNPESQIPAFASFEAGDITFTGTEYPAKISSSLWSDANWGLRVQQATGAFTSKQVEIAVYPTGTALTQIRVKAGQSLYFTRGTYENAIEAPIVGNPTIVLFSNTSVRGDGIGQTIIKESSVAGHARGFYASGVELNPFDGYNENITVRDLTILGQATQTTDSAASAIFLGNIKNGTITNVEVSGTHGFGAYAGGFPTAGFQADGVYITHCIFRDLKTQNAGVISGKNVLIAYNFFLNIQTNAGNPFLAAIDIEPNTDTEIADNIQVIGNLFDGRGALQNWSAITVQSGGNFNGIRGCRVAGNFIVGEELTSVAARKLVNGVTLAGSDGCTVENNYIQGTGSQAIAVYNSVRTVLRNNTGRLVSGGGNKATLLAVVGESQIDGNIFDNTGLSGASNSGIDEAETATTVNTASAVVTRTAGDLFHPFWVGRTVNITGTDYTVLSVQSLTQLTLTASAGTQTGATLTPKFSSNTFSGNKADGITLSSTGTSRILSDYLRVVADSYAPVQLTANTNNYNPGRSSYRLDLSTDASRNLTGLVFTLAQIDGERHVIYNAGSFDIVLKNQDAASTAANRFKNSTGADITLTAGQAADTEYVGGSVNRWAVFKRN